MPPSSRKAAISTGAHCCLRASWLASPRGCVWLIPSAEVHTSIVFLPLFAHTSGKLPHTPQGWTGRLPRSALHLCSWPNCYLATPIGFADRSTSLLHALAGSTLPKRGSHTYGWPAGDTFKSQIFPKSSPTHSQSDMMAKRSPRLTNECILGDPILF